MEVIKNDVVQNSSANNCLRVSLLKLAGAVLVLSAFCSFGLGYQQVELTDSFSTVQFNWSGNCNDNYSLNCRSAGRDVIIDRFGPLDSGASCFFQAFGFSAGRNYSCTISTSYGFMVDLFGLSFTTLLEGKQ